MSLVPNSAGAESESEPAATATDILLDPAQKRILSSSDSFVKLVEAERELYRQDNVPESDSELASIDDDRDVHVCVRVRPILEIEKARIAESFDVVSQSGRGKVVIHVPSFTVRGKPRLESKEFEVDHAFGQDSTTEALYNQAVRSLVSLAAGGGCCTLFAYGQTGSGKTYTMTGIEELIARDIFESISAQGRVRVFCSFFELLGKNATDLLSVPPGKPLDIKENLLGEVEIGGLEMIEAENTDVLLKLIRGAAALRKTETTYRNDVSSRSHGLCVITTKNELIPEAEDGRLFLVDLAGSERRADRLRHDAQREAESRLNNESLSNLKECMRQRSCIGLAVSGSKVHVPYRRSRLTFLLKDAFEVVSFRPTRTLVIACVSPHCLDASHTINTCQYAAPIRLSLAVGAGLERDPDDPVGWTHDQLRLWIQWANTHPETLASKLGVGVGSSRTSGKAKTEAVMQRVLDDLENARQNWMSDADGSECEFDEATFMANPFCPRTKGKPAKGLAVPIDPDVLVPTESGAQLARMSESEFIRRCQSQEDKPSLEAAKDFYVRFWGLIVDARTRRRGGMVTTNARDRIRETGRVKAKLPGTEPRKRNMGEGYTETKISQMRRERGLKLRKKLEKKEKGKEEEIQDS